MIRRTSIFSGRVQGVGFRYTTQAVAEGFAVKGYVRNMPDGTVEAVAEGDRADIERFLETLGEKMDGYIKRRTDNDSPATGEFSDFSVRR
jgi:acylphosphatase